MGLHNPCAVLAVGLAGSTGNVGGVKHVFGLHAGGVLCVAAHHKVQPFDGARHLHIARCQSAVLAVGVVAHVGGGNHHVGAGMARSVGGLQFRRHATRTQAGDAAAGQAADRPEDDQPDQVESSLSGDARPDDAIAQDAGEVDNPEGLGDIEFGDDAGHGQQYPPDAMPGHAGRGSRRLLRW